tara:strand:+ start:664 stop:843 length:180 start_codon:yes stop_codon:yes gene_type:complete
MSEQVNIVDPQLTKGFLVSELQLKMESLLPFPPKVKIKTLVDLMVSVASFKHGKRMAYA